MKNYVDAIRGLRAQILQIEQNAEEQIKPLRFALKTLESENETCENCGGDGTIRGYDAAGQLEDCTCRICQGSRKSRK